MLRFSSYLSGNSVLALERQIDKFYDIHIRALIVKFEGRTNRCTIHIKIHN